MCTLIGTSLLTAVLLSTGDQATGLESLESLIEAGHWKRARSAAESRLKANPNDAQTLSLFSRVKAAFGDLEGALPLAEKAVALDGDSASYHLRLANVCGQIAERASMLKRISYGKRFKKEMDTALAIDPKNLDALEAQMNFLWNAPGVFGGDRKKAHETADRMEQINPERGNLAQADLAAMEKDTAKWEEYLLKVVQVNPQSYAGLAYLANYYAAQKKYDLSEKYARQALTIDPGRARAYSVLAYLYAVQERWADIDAVLASAEKNVPDNLAPHYTAGNTMLSQGKDLVRAEGCFRKYLTQEPEARTPTHAGAHWRLGLVLEKEGRKAEAIAELETAARMDPASDPIKKDLKRLKC